MRFSHWLFLKPRLSHFLRKFSYFVIVSVCKFAIPFINWIFKIRILLFSLLKVMSPRRQISVKRICCGFGVVHNKICSCTEMAFSIEVCRSAREKSQYVWNIIPREVHTNDLLIEIVRTHFPWNNLNSPYPYFFSLVRVFTFLLRFMVPANEILLASLLMFRTDFPYFLLFERLPFRVYNCVLVWIAK